MWWAKSFRMMSVATFLFGLVLASTGTVGSESVSGTGTEIWVSRSGDRSDSSCEEFIPGETIEVYFRVHEPTLSIQIWDFVASQEQPLLFDQHHGVPQRVSPGEVTHALGKTATELGSETLLLQAETRSGVVITAACAFSVVPEGQQFFEMLVYTPMQEHVLDVPRGDTDILHLGINELDRGCNVLYHLGQRVDLLFRVEASHPVRAVVSNASREGSLKTILAESVPPSTTRPLQGTVSGTMGVSTFILRALVGERGWCNCHCPMHVRETCNMSEGFETGTLSNLPWRTGTTYAEDEWRVTSTSRHSGRYAAQVASVSDYERSFLALGFSTGQPGMLSFWYKVSSEASCDFLRFYIDGNERDSWSGEVGWTKVSFPLSAGTYILSWVYEKDEDGAAGQDTAWIDDIHFQP